MRRYTIRQFDKEFPDDRACLAFLFKARWPQGVVCARCEERTKHFPRSHQRAYSCMHCGTLVFPTAGTIFHKSPTPLRLWFYAMYLMAQTRCGISAKQLERELGVTYKTAWRMFKQIRMLMEEDAHDLQGPMEADETQPDILTYHSMSDRKIMDSDWRAVLQCPWHSDLKGR